MGYGFSRKVKEVQIQTTAQFMKGTNSNKCGQFRRWI